MRLNCTRPWLSGFTLIELLVALSVLAVMALMSWRSIDGMVQTQKFTERRGDEVMVLQMGLAQWVADLDAMENVSRMPSMDWDGRVLRLVRRSALANGDSPRVVAWVMRVINGQGQWLRWQSAALHSLADLQMAWQKASQWAQNPDDSLKRQEVIIVPLVQWQLYYFRGNAWVNPLSSDGSKSLLSSGAALPGAVTPDGVRLVLSLPTGSALGGVMTRDWVRPTLGGNRS